MVPELSPDDGNMGDASDSVFEPRREQDDPYYYVFPVIVPASSMRLLASLLWDAGIRIDDMCGSTSRGSEVNVWVPRNILVDQHRLSEHCGYFVGEGEKEKSGGGH